MLVKLLQPENALLGRSLLPPVLVEVITPNGGRVGFGDDFRDSRRFGSTLPAGMPTIATSRSGAA